ncbi:DUF1593 domain-containing protein [Vibrio mangrovi]|uniref:DUF1593 domain-containing protein n=1 Tax=Vibrio mangrovi TaxID=474394 RepID=A0A1Y6ISC9_9VIBR|nr:DUF1593 domain-containing protein [Vibrio mangrovi]MDW6001423.1 DUF1593 domain-containing protein [Vibrio mangrovi]SMS00555.1 hypothetical protein VIM7927_01821 [Vibrio mangrovi]
MIPTKLKVLPLLMSALVFSGISLAENNVPHTDGMADKTRVIVLTDIGNEPDDSESFVRFLTYSNEFEIENIVATTSTWQRDQVQPELLKERIDAYAKVYPNLIRHAEGFPTPESLKAKILSGRVAYGMKGVGHGLSTQASRSIIATVDKSDDRPVWITLWGGGVDLAQALWDVKATRTSTEVADFISKIRVYSISDQDNTGAWIRRNFPTMTWISSIHSYNDYWLATWVGISAPNLEGADMAQVNNDWVKKHIRLGPLGEKYPPIMYIMEGDSPSFIYLLKNGLNVPEHPEYGSWGGRYAPVAPDDESGLRTGTSDNVLGTDGKMHKTAPATIWRFRHQFQNDFAGRIQWTLTDNYANANHNPVVKLNGEPGIQPLQWQVKSGEKVVLSAKGSSDPDNNQISYRWWQYGEPTAQALQIHFAPEIKLANDSQESTSFIAPEVSRPTPFHVILEVHDNGTPEMYAYRRAIVTVMP